MSNPNVGGVNGGQLRSLIQRIESLNEAEAELKADKREVFAEAKAFGYDPKIMRKVIALRKMDDQERSEQQDLVAIYMQAVEDGPDIATHALDAREAAE